MNIIVKKKPCKCVYDSVRIQRTDFPVLTCAASVIDGEYKIAIGARPGKACLFGDDKNILSNGITNESASLFAKDSISYGCPKGKGLGSNRNDPARRTCAIFFLFFSFLFFSFPFFSRKRQPHTRAAVFVCFCENFAGLSMMCDTLEKSQRACLGEFQLRGLIGKSLYLRSRTES